MFIIGNAIEQKRLIVIALLIAILLGVCIAINDTVTSIAVGIVIFSILILKKPEVGLAFLVVSSYPYYLLLDRIYGFKPEISKNITAAYLIMLTVVYLLGILISKEKKPEDKKRTRIYKDMTIISFLGLSLLIFINFILFSINSKTAIDSIAYFALLCFIPFFAIIYSGKLKVRKIMKSIYILLLIFLFFSLIMFIINRETTKRFTPIEGYQNAISAALLYAFFIPLSIIRAFFAEKHRILLSFISIFTVIASIILIIYTGSRGPLIALILSVITITPLMIFKRRYFENWRYKLFGIALILLILFLSYSPLLVREEASLGYVRFMKFIENPSQEAVDRINRYRFTIEELRENLGSLIFGIGIGKFEEKYSGREMITGPHNYILDATIQLGLVGGLLAVIFLLSVFLKGIRLLMKIDKQKEEFLILMFLSVYIISMYFSMFSGTIMTHSSLYISSGGIVVLYNCGDE